MKMLEIHGLDQPVSRLIMGSDFFTPETYGHVARVLDDFTALGGNTIDTAYIYCGGKSEQAIGMWLEERQNRKDIRIWTKGGHPNQDGKQVNRQAIRDQLDESLERLRTDYVDLYALHRDDPDVEVAVILDILNELVEEGKIQAFGGSNWSWQRLQEANRYAEANGLRGFSFSSPNLSLAKAKEPYWPDCISADAETIGWHRRTGLALLSWSSQARGFFTGRYTREDCLDPDLVRVFYNDANWERYDRASKLAASKGVETIQIALAYVLHQPFPTGAIIGARNRKELESCFAAARLSLTEPEIAWLDLQPA
ncbi:aldo/keto reductase [Paenibacillus thiaminolyticus]|uniref:aldo/keto reductase n=1 Tax=Paenibacillus thiaminolyticus TaxID=49283 RepID=UPI0035A68B60